MTALTIRVHRDGTVTADGKRIGRVYKFRYRNAQPHWIARRRSHLVARTRLRTEAVSALLDHTYGKDRWT